MLSWCTYIIRSESRAEMKHSSTRRRAARMGTYNKTAKGARRRSVIVSVLQSLRANLRDFSLGTVLEEVTHWMNEGISLFAAQWRTLQEKETAPQPTG